MSPINGRTLGAFTGYFGGSFGALWYFLGRGALGALWAVFFLRGVHFFLFWGGVHFLGAYFQIGYRTLVFIHSIKYNNNHRFIWYIVVQLATMSRYNV